MLPWNSSEETLCRNSIILSESILSASCLVMCSTVLSAPTLSATESNSDALNANYMIAFLSSTEMLPVFISDTEFSIVNAALSEDGFSLNRSTYFLM